MQHSTILVNTPLLCGARQVNCLFTASYSLYLRGVMDKVVALTVNKTKLDEFSMVFYNNVLSLPLIFALMWWYGEIHTLPQEPALQNPIFLIAAGSSALVRGLSLALPPHAPRFVLYVPMQNAATLMLGLAACYSSPPAQ